MWYDHFHAAGCILPSRFVMRREGREGVTGCVRENALNLSILISGGKETNRDSLSKGD